MGNGRRLITDRRQVLAGLGAGVVAGALGWRMSNAYAQASEIVLCNYGGTDVDDMSAAFTGPFTKDTGIPVAYDTAGPNAGKIRAMMEGGKAIWDVCDSSPSIGIDLGAQGLLEEIDYSIVDAKKVPEGLAGKYSMASYYFTTMIAYDKDAFGGKVPQNWADFWNVKDFPGKRGFFRISQGMLEAAMMADGVPMDQVYPIDVDRALKKIKEIKEHCIFWRGGADVQQLMRSGEVTMVACWNGTASQVAKDTNDRWQIQWNQGVLQSAAWVVPKGNPAGRENAMKLIASMQDPERQAAYMKRNNNGPVNPEADKFLTEEEAARSPGSAENRPKQLPLNYEWLSKNYSTVEPMYIAAISE
jgi:putative spermidine/putrescine transport system substrate-binding protein